MAKRGGTWQKKRVTGLGEGRCGFKGSFAVVSAHERTCPVLDSRAADVVVDFALPAEESTPEAAVVTESARAHSYFFSKEVQKTGQFWLLTFWLLTVYLRVFLTRFSGFVQF